MALIAVVVRRPVFAVMAVAIFVVYLMAEAFGFAQDNSAGGAYMMFVTLMVVFIPPTSRPMRGAHIVVMAVALAQIGILWAAALNNSVITGWLDALGKVLGIG